MPHIPQTSVFKAWKILNECCYNFQHHDKEMCLVHIAKQHIERFNMVQMDVDKGEVITYFPKDTKRYDPDMLDNAYKAILNICAYCTGYHNEVCYVSNARKAIEILLYGKFCTLKMTTFGEFLVNKGVITKDQITEAYHIQKQMDIPYSALAMAKGLISIKDAIKIIKCQKQRQMDFLEAGVDLSLITVAQSEMLKSFKKDLHIYIGEILVGLGFISEEEKERLFNEYERAKKG